MEDPIKYSVIIPIYNAEKTLRRCLDSLLSQNREDIEIIVIDDGSFDKSQEILVRYLKRYKELKVLTQPNSGVSKARNAGLKQAIGTYILFVDGDDYVSEDYFVTLDQMGDADLCVFARQTIGGAHSDQDFFRFGDWSGSFTENVEALLIGRKMLPPWNKRFKRKIIEKHQTRFVEKFQIGEDFDFCMNYARHCRSIEICGEVLYYLDVSDRNSLSRKYRPFLNQKLKEVYLHIEKLWLETEENEFKRKRMLAAVDYLYARNVFTCISEERKQRKWRCVQEYFKNREKYKNLCGDFRMVIGGNRSYVNIIHGLIRLLLKKEMTFSLYMITCLAGK